MQLSESQEREFPFTRFLLNLEPDQPRDREGFQEVWQALRVLLVGELKRRSLWGLPPACLGIHGCASWTDEGALEELVADCFLFVFGERLRALKAHLRFKSNIEGLVLRSVRNFLHEAQKRHDPLGFRVFTVLRTAAREMVVEGALHVIAGSPKIGRDTVLAWDPEMDAAQASTARSEELRGRTSSWNDDLLPQLVTARGREVRPVVERIEEHLHRLRDRGVGAFRFQDLLEPLRHDARLRWRAVWVQSEGETAPGDDQDFGSVVRLVTPTSRLEERQCFHCLLRCLEGSIDNLPEPGRSREDLHRILLFLRNYAMDPTASQTRPPSHRKLAELLAIPRERLPHLRGILLELTESCRRRCSGVSSLPGGPR